MEINEYGPKQNRLSKAVSEYEASQVKAQQIKSNPQNTKPAHVNIIETPVIKGEVVDLRFNEVKIRLQLDGRIISGKLSGDVPLSIGQTAEFAVSGEADGQVILRYIATESSPVNDIIHKALHASGLSASERNTAIVRELLNYQMPVDKNTILQMIKLSSANPGVSPETIVLMLKNKLPIDSASIAQFESYREGTHQILNQLKALIGSIRAITFDGYMLSAKFITADIAKAFARTTHEESTNIDIMGNKAPAGTDGDTGINGNVPQNHMEPDNIQAGVNAAYDAARQSRLPSGNIPGDASMNTDAWGIIYFYRELMYILTDSSISAAIPDIRPGAASVAVPQTFSEALQEIQPDNTSTTSSEKMPEGIPGIIWDNMAEIMPENAINMPAGEIFSTGDIAWLKNLFASDGGSISKEALTRLAEGTMTPEDLLSAIHDMFTGWTQKPAMENPVPLFNIVGKFIDLSDRLSADGRQKVVSLLNSEAYRDELAKALHARWTINPNDIADGEKVKDFYRRLEGDMKRLERLAEPYGTVESTDVKASINKLQDNLQFMKVLNDLFLYVQLPLRLLGQDAHGDLYVFTRKYQKPGASEGLNVLLHLDMAHLGPLDIHLYIMNRQINAVFYTEKASSEIISRHLDELVRSLDSKGYRFLAKTQVSDGKPDFITDILQQDASEPGIHRYTFDIRA